jgi:hypothetical protein
LIQKFQNKGDKMEDTLKEVVVRKCSSAGSDSVFLVKNLPSKFIYGDYPVMVGQVDRDGYQLGTVVPDPTGKTEKKTHEGIQYNEDTDTFMFFSDSQEGARRLQDIDLHIDAVLPREMRRPVRVLFTSQKDNFQAPPITRSKMPVVELPEQFKAASSPVSPQEQSLQGKAADLDKLKAMQERMAKARAARVSNKTAVV